MFSVHCPRHGSRVLLSERRIRAMDNTPDGIVVELECHDGARLRIVTGRRAEQRPAAVREAHGRDAVAALRARAPVAC
jgi:hypothetical protein